MKSMRVYPITILVVFIVVALAIYVNFGAITPCGIVKVNMQKRYNMMIAGRLRNDMLGTDEVKQTGAVMGIMLAHQMLNSFVDTLTTDQCLKMLMRDYEPS